MIKTLLKKSAETSTAHTGDVSRARARTRTNHLMIETMKRHRHNLCGRAIHLTLLSIALCAYANPVGFDADREMSHISFLVVAAVCFTVEVVIIAAFF